MRQSVLVSKGRLHFSFHIKKSNALNTENNCPYTLTAPLIYSECSAYIQQCKHVGPIIYLSRSQIAHDCGSLCALRSFQWRASKSGSWNFNHFRCITALTSCTPRDETSICVQKSPQFCGMCDARRP